MTRTAWVLAASALLAGSSCVTQDKARSITYDNRRGGTVTFVATLESGDEVELVTLTVEDGGALIRADQRVFDDENCSTRPIEARSAEGDVLFEFPVGSCHEFVVE